MRRLIRLAAALYPRGWRERYGVEFQALLEDGDPGLREFADVLLGAFKMQMLTTTAYLKIAGTVAVAGAIVAAAASFGVPRQYVSEAVVRMTPNAGTQAAPPAPPQKVDSAAAEQFRRISAEVFSRSSLAEIILEPSLDLYKDVRRRMPMEDVILQMQKDFRISPLPPSGGDTALTASISFAYRDKEKSQEVLRRLVTRYAEINTRDNEYRARFWRQVWPSDTVPPGEVLKVLDPASLPKSISPNRLAFMTWGLGAGLLLGLLATSAMRRPKWTLQMAGFAVAGCALAVAVSFLVPDKYTSTATMRFVRPFVPVRISSDVAGMPAIERFQQLEHEILSRGSLSQIILKPSIDLYAKQRADTPLEDIIERMRSRDLSIQVMNSTLGSEPAFTISFTYPDRYKAWAVVREVVSQFENQYIRAMHSRAMDLNQGDVRTALEHKLGENIEVLDPPRVPESPSRPRRLTFTTAGLALGLLAGALTLRFRGHRGANLQPA